MLVPMSEPRHEAGGKKTGPGQFARSDRWLAGRHNDNDVVPPREPKRRRGIEIAEAEKRGAATRVASSECNLTVGSLSSGSLDCFVGTRQRDPDRPLVGAVKRPKPTPWSGRASRNGAPGEIRTHDLCRRRPET